MIEKKGSSPDFPLVNYTNTQMTSIDGKNITAIVHDVDKKVQKFTYKLGESTINDISTVLDEEEENTENFVNVPYDRLKVGSLIVYDPTHLKERIARCCKIDKIVEPKPGKCCHHKSYVCMYDLFTNWKIECVLNHHD